MARRYFVYISLIFLFISIIFATVNVRAHSPSNMNLTYDSNIKVLEVTITHDVTNRNTHYVESVVIKVNGSTASSESYNSQPTTGTFTYTFNNITANNGATIQVTATCNIGGSISRSITIGDGAPPPEDQNGDKDGNQVISGYLGFLLILGGSLVMVLSIIYKKMKK